MWSCGNTTLARRPSHTPNRPLNAESSVTFRREPGSDNGSTVVTSSSTTFMKTRVDGASIADEVRATKLASARGLAPRVLATTTATTLVTARARGRHRTTLSDDDVAAVARTLAALHARKAPASL